MTEQKAVYLMAKPVWNDRPLTQIVHTIEEREHLRSFGYELIAAGSVPVRSHLDALLEE